MAKTDNRHVVPHPDGWAVKKPDAQKPSSVHETKAEAVERGIEIARNTGGSLKIHKKDGTIQEERTYGKDPYPPPG